MRSGRSPRRDDAREIRRSGARWRHRPASCAPIGGDFAKDGRASARRARGPDGRSSPGVSHRRIIAASELPRNSRSSEPWRPSRLCSLRWPSAIKPHGSGASPSIRTSASARIKSHAGPNRGCPRPTARRTTPSTCSIARATICGSTRCTPLASARKPLSPTISASATASILRISGHSCVTTWNKVSRLSAAIAASTAWWIEATAPEWPRAKAIRS